MSNFTPGPWCAAKQHCHVVLGKDRKFVAETVADFRSAAVSSSNARLIAAAPEMYEALKAVLNRGCNCYSVADENFHSSKCVMPKVLAALAKVEGKQP